MPDRDTIEKRIIPALMANFALFGNTVLKIYDADSNLIPFAPNKFQAELYRQVRNLHRIFAIHKSRQLGNSTAIAAYLFFLACFTPRYRVVVVANQFKNAEGLWKIYARFVEHMPDWLREYLGVTAPHMHVRFAHGGFIDFYTSDSDGVRSQTYQAAHLSEVAHWPDPDRTFASVMGALSGSDPLIFQESTAKGLNIWHDLWVSESSTKKLFFSWVMDRDLDGPSIPLTARMPKHLADLATTWNLLPGQLRWAYKKYTVDCHNSVLLFRQEFPATAEEAFVASGDRVLTSYWSSIDQWQEGPMDWVEGHPRPYVPYVIGADVAHGAANGDYSAIVVTDNTDPKRPVIVHTNYIHLPPLQFAKVLHETGNRFGGLVVPERNENGVSVIEWLTQQKDTKYTIFHEVTLSTDGVVLKKVLGWNTNQQSRSMIFNAVVDAVDSGRVHIPDPRLQEELQFLVWKGGRPDHDSSHHTDMTVALGLALNGNTQAGTGVRQSALFDKSPRTLEEIVRWNTTTGLKYHENTDRFVDATFNNESTASVGGSLLGL
jgi:hypothetical protein